MAMERRTRPVGRTIRLRGRADAIDQDCTSAGRDSGAATDEDDIGDRVFRQKSGWKDGGDVSAPHGPIHSSRRSANSSGG